VPLKKDLYQINVSLPQNDTKYLGHHHLHKLETPVERREFSHGFPIETVVYKETPEEGFLYTVDSKGYGKVTVHERQIDLIPNESVYASGWVGITAHPTSPLSVVTARFLDKTVLVYDQDKIVRRFQAVNHPTQLHFVPSLNILSILEYNTVALYDLRQGSGNGSIRNVPLPSTLPAYALACRSDMIAVGGAGRNITIFDTRSWKVRGTLKNSTKYEICSVLFASDSENLYVGDDSVITLNQWNAADKPSHNYLTDSLRLESRHLGVARNGETDTVMALTENGVVYVVKRGAWKNIQNQKTEDEGDVEPERKKLKK